MKKWLRTAASLALVAGVWALGWAQDPKPAIDNEHVTVWDEIRPAGVTNAARDTVVMWIAGPKARTAEFIPKGSSGGKGDKGSRSLVIELKDAPAAHYDNKTGDPAAFPRPHVKKLFENNRVVMWSYRWTPGEPTPMHFHDKDVVVVYLEPTALVSTTPNGAKKLNEYQAFDIRFNKGDRTHTESLAHGEGSAMMMELK
jgi:hypothetical protein